MQIKSIAQKLSSGEADISQVITDTSLMKFHPDTEFREIIKGSAKQGIISLVSSSEPGNRITVKGTILDRNNNPLSNVQVYIYHTDNKGWYSDTAGHVSGMEGDRRHARLFGYLKSNNDGSFEFNTIHPAGYPNSNLPQHIHFEVFDNNGVNLIVTELLFDEDTRLNDAMRQRMINESAFIAANSGTPEKPVYAYTVKRK